MAAPMDALRGECPQIVAIRTQITHLLSRQTSARRLPPVLILGETGTGKGLLARTIHRAGPHHDGPFVDVNCAAIPETLLEAELFGYERGAFTDARQAKPGLFQAAQGGALFLDEIGLLPVALQSKLLTVLEDRVVRRLGSTRAEPVDVALIAATSVDLKRAVGEGSFRGDLYHRLAVISVELPPLRARGRDILALAEHFLVRACADYGLAPRALTDGAREILVAYRWPGNVRELANVIERVVLLSEADEITAEMLDCLTVDNRPRPESQPGDTRDNASIDSRDDALRARIETALRDNGGSIRRTATALGISRNTLRARMDKYGLRHTDASTVSVEPRGSESLLKPRTGGSVQWERRHLAFLQTRLLSPSTVNDSRVLEVTAEKIRGFGGRLEDSSPTDVIGVFGLEPVDNAAGHAALAALAIQKAMADERAAVVTAIHCADHILGRDESGLQIGVDGKAGTWSTLETLIACNRPDAIVVSSAAVPFLTRRFVVERLREVEGEVWVVQRREGAAAVRGSSTRFVGRAAELDVLRQACSRVERRQGQIVGIVGEAGVGKSRLLHEAVRQLQGWLVLAGGGAPYAKNTSYFPMVEILKSYCRIQDTDTASEVRERAARKLSSDIGHPVRFLPPILDVLGVLPTDDAFRSVAPLQRRQRMQDAIKQVLLAASTEQPLCLIVEDLHWIDAQSQEVVDLLAESIMGSHILLLVNYRPEYQHGWGSRSNYTQVRLDPFPTEEVDELLVALLGNDPSLDTIKQMLRTRTEGNPLFLEECARALVETQSLVGEVSQYRLRTAQPHFSLPLTVQAVIATRMNRLSSDEKNVLQSAAVIGKDVRVGILRSVAGVSDEAFDVALKSLQRAEFMHETRAYPDLEYTFKHVLTHEVVYDSVLPKTRRELHARIVEVIERLHHDRLDEHVERLAHHALLGDRREKAVDYLRRAGLKAAARSAQQDARSWFEQALSVLDALPASRSTLELAFDIRLDLWPLYTQLGEIPPNLARETEALAERMNDDVRRGQVGALVMGDQAMLGELDEALATGTRVLAIVQRLGDPTLRMRTTSSLVMTHYFRGDYARVVELVVDNLGALTVEEMSTYVGIGAPASVFFRAWLIMTLHQLGRFTEAAAHESEAMRLAELSNHAFPVGFALRGAATRRLLKGDWVGARSVTERWVDVVRAGNLGIQLPQALASSAWTLAQLGETDAALGRIEEGERAIARGTAGGIVVNFGWIYQFLGRAALLVGRLDEARRLADRAVEWTTSQFGFAAHARHLLGDIAAHPDQFDAEGGEVHYREALALAEPRGMRPLVAGCHLGLGKLSRRTGNRHGAREHLTTAATMYRDLDMTFWLEQVEKELGALG
jgi:DNA-binding NtrC family response regulator